MFPTQSYEAQMRGKAQPEPDRPAAKLLTPYGECD